MTATRNVIYGEGGFDPTKPNGNIVEEFWADDVTGERVELDADAPT